MNLNVNGCAHLQHQDINIFLFGFWSLLFNQIEHLSNTSK